jgi:hypothetical protein
MVRAKLIGYETDMAEDYSVEMSHGKKIYLGEYGTIKEICDTEYFRFTTDDGRSLLLIEGEFQRVCNGK